MWSAHTVAHATDPANSKRIARSIERCTDPRIVRICARRMLIEETAGDLDGHRRDSRCATGCASHFVNRLIGGGLKLTNALALALALPASADADSSSRLPCASANLGRYTNSVVLAAVAVPNVAATGVTPPRFVPPEDNTDSVHFLVLSGPGATDVDGRTPRDFAAAESRADSADSPPAAKPVPSTTSGTTSGDTTESQRSPFRVFELKDSHGFSQFKLTFNRTKVAISGIRMRLSLTRRNCNAHVIDRFNSEMTELIDRFTGNYDAGVQTIEIGLMNLGIRIDGKSYVWSDSVRTGRLFRRLPREIHRMKVEEKLNCSADEASGNTGQLSTSAASFLGSQSGTGRSAWH